MRCFRTEASKAQAAEDLAAALDEQMANTVKVVSGDFMVYVHVIEARELKAKVSGYLGDEVR